MRNEQAHQDRKGDPWLLWCIPFEVLIGVGVALATFQVLLELIRLWIGTELFGGYIFGIGALILGGLAGLGFAVFALTRREPKFRLMVDIAGLVFWLVGFVIPREYEDYKRKAEEHARTEKAVTEKRTDQIEFNAWLENLKKTGQHAPPGVVPPMLTVEDNGTTVKVTNIHDKEIVVALARVRQDPAAPGGWKGCGMYEGARGSRFYFIYLGPRKSLMYTPWEECAGNFVNAPIEYRIGQRPPEIGWWSDSAFAKPEGREYEGIR